MAELQTIPGRHGVATFVPAGQTIKIINTSGTQVVDTWAFALPTPGEPRAQKSQESSEETGAKQQKKTKGTKSNHSVLNKPVKNGQAELPSQEEAERTTKEAMDGDKDAAQKSSWSSYVPSLGWSSSKKEGDENDDGAGDAETEQQKNSRTWSTYFPSGKGFSNYIPQSATDTVSAFASSHKRDPNKSYVEQLQDFSKTPVGAAGWSGLAALTGSGYKGSVYAGYQAWNSQAGPDGMSEFLSMPHTRAATLHLQPRPGDLLVSNLREPMLTFVEDTSPGIHDTLIAACDPARYKGLGVNKWEEHGSCAENLVLALKELNERAGLTGVKAVGSNVTVNSVPAPLNLFMNIPWTDDGDLNFHATKCKAKAYVRLKAERDLVVVMSACPQDVLDINSRKPTDAHFIVEDDETPADALKRTQVRKPTAPKKATAPAPKTNAKPVPSTNSVAQKKPTPKAAAAPRQAAVTNSSAPQPARKKPIPPPVNPQRKQAATQQTKTETPAVRKKPRKLNPRPVA